MEETISLNVCSLPSTVDEKDSDIDRKTDKQYNYSNSMIPLLYSLTSLQVQLQSRWFKLSSYLLIRLYTPASLHFRILVIS